MQDDDATSGAATPEAFPEAARDRIAALEQELALLRSRHDELLARVSHDLRTPLVAGLGYVELLLEGRLGRVSARGLERLAVARDNLRWLGQRIDDLVTFYRLSGGVAAPLSRDPCVLPPLLQEVAALAADRVAQRHARLELDLPATLPDVRADPESLGRVLAQLVDNALRHNDPGVAVRLVAELVPGPRVRVAVVDDGASLSPRRLQALQEPGPAGARRGGIGLPLVRLLLARQGTTLELRAASGAGLWAGFVLDAVTSPVDSPGG